MKRISILQIIQEKKKKKKKKQDTFLDSKMILLKF